MNKKLALAWTLIVCLLVAHNVWLWGVKRIAPDTDILALLPVQQRDPVLQLSFSHMVDAAQQRVIVLIGAPRWSDARRAADAYRAVLAKQPALLSSSNTDEQTQQDWLTLFEQHRSLLISATQQKNLQQRDAGYWVDTAQRQLYNPFAGPKLGTWRDDPFGLFADWVQERARETPVRPRDGYLFVADKLHQYVLLSLVVRDPVFAMSTQHAVTALLDQAHAAALQAVPQADLITAGVILHAAAAGRQARDEAWTIGLGSLLGIVLLMWATFHSLKPIALILLSIAMGCLGALSLCWLWFGHIHLLTLVFGASLIGVAQDYGIFFLSHRLHASTQLDSATLLKRLLPSLALTLVAALIGYLGLAFTPFPGLRNMAVFSALGLVFAWLTVICWFPQLIGSAGLKSAALVDWYDRALSIWPRWTFNRIGIAIALLLSVSVAFGISRLRSNDDIRLLQNSPAQLIADQIRLSKLLDAPTPVQFYLVRAPTEQQLLEREEALMLRLDPLIAQQKISGYQAISNWIPSEKTQQAHIDLLREKLLSGPLRSLAHQIGEDETWVAETRAQILAAGPKLTVAQFMRSPSSEPWRHLWLGQTPDGYASIVALRGLAQANLPAVQHAGDGLDGVQWVDKVAEISGVLGQYRYSMGWVVGAAYLLVFAVLFARYRAETWRVLAPAALASLIALAVFGYLHQPLQMFHVLALMLLLGIGVDYGIFMQERGVARSAWLAIGLSAANTLLSFGLLALSQTPALQAFGSTMLIGIGMVWIIVPLFRKESAYDN